MPGAQHQPEADDRDLVGRCRKSTTVFVVDFSVSATTAMTADDDRGDDRAEQPHAPGHGGDRAARRDRARAPWSQPGRGR